MATADSRGGAGRAASSRTPIQLAALAVGAGFLLVGALGFIPGATTNYDTLGIAGHQSEALLLGLFNVSVLHNLVHVAFGVAGILMARTVSLSRIFLIGGGLVYVLLVVFGLVIDHDSAINFVPINNADNWLHLGLAVGMIGLGLLLGNRGRRPVAASSTTIDSPGTAR